MGSGRWLTTSSPTTEDSATLTSSTTTAFCKLWKNSSDCKKMASVVAAAFVVGWSKMRIQGTIMKLIFSFYKNHNVFADLTVTMRDDLLFCCCLMLIMIWTSLIISPLSSMHVRTYNDDDGE